MTELDKLISDIQSYAQPGRSEGTISRILFGDGSRVRLLKAGEVSITERVLRRARADLDRMISGEAGVALRAWRQRIGRTKAQAAALFSVSTTTYGNWEEGGVPPERVPELNQVTSIPMHVLRPDDFSPPRETAEAA